MAPTSRDGVAKGYLWYDVSVHKLDEPLGRKDLAVVGAGPVGIASLWSANRQGLDAIAIEAAASPLETVRRFLPGLVTVSTPDEWAIDGLPVDCRDPHEVTREDLLSYYARVLAYGRLPVACSQSLVALDPSVRDVRVTLSASSATH